MKKNRVFIFWGTLVILLICILNKKTYENGESIKQTENTYMKAYEAYLRSFPELNDYKYSSVALRDLDKNGVSELIIVQVDEVDGILKVYSYDNSVYKIGEYSDSKIGISAIHVSENPKFPGLFNQWWGGGVEHYGYLEVREKRLIYEDLWYIDRTEPSPYQSNVSNNEALIRESMNIFSDDDYMGNILDTVLINDENISKIFK
ncbi:MAG: hypothetical protein HFG78_13765 [Hungatella sp.]|nr:hypothetical protein [Hungatella sp.]MCI9503728.1 hypothetical protein [Hungatella sp.]